MNHTNRLTINIFSKFIFFIVFLFGYCTPAISTGKDIQYVDKLQNTRHPSIGYWFITPETLQGDAYLKQIEEFARTTPYDLIFLTARNGIDFFDVEKMHPVFERLVRKADSLHIGIGLQIWVNVDPNVTEANCSRTIVETEGKLDDNGQGIYKNKPRGVRIIPPFKNQLFRVYAFKKCGEGTYTPGSLHDITHLCHQTGNNEEFQIEVKGGKELAGYDVYIQTEILYNQSNPFSDYTISSYIQLMKAYADIPFKGFGLDEYGYMAFKTDWILNAEKEVIRTRHYSPAMKQQYQTLYNRDLDKDLFKMRYSPLGDDSEKIKAINFYMDVMRHGPLKVENALARYAKTIYGPDVFLGLHNTFHNDFDNDEIWATGVNWWTLPRDYGHSDENIATPIQMGIGMANVQNVMYNMYYHKNVNHFANKALTDLRYGIRTHYHALNDGSVWGVSLETPEVAPLFMQVERMAKLANHFNATYADARILVITGMEALVNWYPEHKKRNMFDINGSLGFQQKAREMWNAGYLNAVVPTDLIENDWLTLNQENKPTLNGHIFDVVVLLNPQYAKPKTIDFLRRYVNGGGKLVVEGTAQKDFYGNDLAEWQKEIESKAVAVGYSLENIAQLGIAKNEYKNGNRCVDGAIVYTDFQSLKENTRTDFSITIGTSVYTGKYQGFIALDANEQGEIKRFACGAFDELFCNGKSVLKIKSPADIVLINDKQGLKIKVVGSKEQNEVFRIVDQSILKQK